MLDGRHPFDRRARALRDARPVRAGKGFLMDSAASPPPDDSAPPIEPVAPSEEELKDRMIGEFRILRRLGRGGMAEVYLAEQTSLNRQVAVKVLRAELLGDEVHVKRFEREARAAAGLRHGNIVQVYVVGAQQGVHYIAQEYVQGLNLREYLNRKGPPDVPVALHLMKQIASALAAAGDAGIVHRDIKPENILITKKGEVKVTDFGLAQLSEPGEPVNLTQIGITMGTPLYMSPEQVSGEKVDQRSDIYSFGVTCYHMLAGRPPYRGETALAVAMRHLNGAPEPLVDRRPDLPPILCQIVHKMMARQPADRYPTAHAILDDLRRVSKKLKGEPDTAREIELADLTPAPRPTPRNRLRQMASGASSRFFDWGLKKQLVAFAAAAFVVGGASAGLGWWLRPGNPLESPVVRSSRVPVAKSAAEQFYAAMVLETDEEAWQAVIDNFPDEPPNANYQRQARERLAWIYLNTDRWNEAETLYVQLSSYGNEDQRLMAIGLAGQAVIASLRGDFQQSQRIVAFDLLGSRQGLARHIQGEMAELVRQAIGRNRRHLGDDVAKGLEENFRADLPDDDLRPAP